MKHWYKTVIRRENDEGVHYTVGTQMFYVDDDVTMASLADVFDNTGIGMGDAALRVYIATNSIPMVHDGVRLPMAKAGDVRNIVLSAMSRGYGKDLNLNDVIAYVMHLEKVLAGNARGAYQLEYKRLYGDKTEEGGGT